MDHNTVLQVVNENAEMLEHVTEAPCRAIVVANYLVVQSVGPDKRLMVFPIPDANRHLPVPENGVWIEDVNWCCGAGVQAQGFGENWFVEANEPDLEVAAGIHTMVLTEVAAVMSRPPSLAEMLADLLGGLNGSDDGSGIRIIGGGVLGFDDSDDAPADGDGEDFESFLARILRD